MTEVMYLKRSEVMVRLSVSAPTFKRMLDKGSIPPPRNIDPAGDKPMWRWFWPEVQAVIEGRDPTGVQESPYRQRVRACHATTEEDDG